MNAVAVVAIAIVVVVGLFVAWVAFLDPKNISGSLAPPLPVSRSQVSVIIFLLVVLTFFTVLPWVISAVVWFQAGNAIQTSPAFSRNIP